MNCGNTKHNLTPEYFKTRSQIMKKRLTLVIVILFLFTTILLAQEKSVEKKDTLSSTTNSSKSIDGVTALNDEINFKNETGNAIITITDEGSNVGSIILPSGSAPSATTNKLYNEGGTLKFNGSDIGAGSGSSGGWTDLGTKIHNTTLTDKIGIGTNNPLSSLSVGGDGTTDAAIYGEATGAGAAVGVFGKATHTGSDNYGGYFDAAGALGRGVYGVASFFGSGSVTYGGYFISNSIEGIGVFGNGEKRGVIGQADYGINARGVYGLATETGTAVNSYGGYFDAAGGRGTGVYGEATDNSVGKNYGGFFEAKADSGIGVYGYASKLGTGLENYGGYFQANGSKGRGVYGNAIGDNGRGVEGEATGEFGGGVSGKATGTSGRGVFGQASEVDNNAENYGGYFDAAGGNGRGVFGHASNAGTGTGIGETYGGYFKADGVFGRGVYGHATTTSSLAGGKAYGGYFVSDGNLGYGVYGEATNGGSGVYGVSTKIGGLFTASNATGIGINGTVDGDDAIGVKGESDGIDGIGVSGYGRGSSGIGILGYGIAHDFDARGPGLNYSATSSKRWKKNIVEIDNPLEKLSKLRGVYYDWDEEHGGGHDVGCIAEEVGEILPEIVAYEENGIDATGMDYSKLTPLLLEVTKAQQKLIEKLTERINALEINQNK